MRNERGWYNEEAQPVFWAAPHGLLGRDIKSGIAETENNAASELIDNYKEMYEEGYLRNWGLGISILFAGLVISKVYKSPVPTSMPKVV